MSYSIGKLPNPVLAKLLSRADQQRRDPRVLVGPRIGEDAAVLDFGENYLVVSTDPITLATDSPGWYAVHVNANDVAVRGAQPRWFSAVLLLPEDRTDDALVTSIFTQIYEACATLGCTLIGGHTEITAELKHPIVVGQMIGEVARDKLVTTAGAQVGDVLLLTKRLAIEGTAVLAREKALQLKERGVAADVLARGRDFLFNPGISIVREALASNSLVTVHSMHDPTEGGVATALAEVAEASGVGVKVNMDKLPILPECEVICRALALDPLGTLASGSLLLSVSKADAESVIRELKREGIPCTKIGDIVPREEGLRLQTREGLVELPKFQRDEITKVL
ncbi:MAG TPA: AIR synthase family protein [Anaerolineae bacterium]|nr:AIR synthase family protein [Anaerolineae bacterium]